MRAALIALALLAACGSARAFMLIGKTGGSSPSFTACGNALLEGGGAMVVNKTTAFVTKTGC